MRHWLRQDEDSHWYHIRKGVGRMIETRATATVSAKDAGEAFAEANSDDQAAFLEAWASVAFHPQSQNEWWAFQCPYIRSSLGDSPQIDNIRRMLSELLSHLERACGS
jgi:hypothetical protein